MTPKSTQKALLQIARNIVVAANRAIVIGGQTPSIAIRDAVEAMTDGWPIDVEGETFIFDHIRAVPDPIHGRTFAVV